MILRNKIFFLLMSLNMFVYSANVEVTTFYGKTGGIVGVLNTTEQVVNGRTICPENPTVGCDFGDDPGFSNNGTVDDPSDDSYSGDLVIRTNDSFQATAGWSWNGEAGGTKEKVTIIGTLPSTGILPDGSTGTTQSYMWDTLPGSCDPAESSISDDKQVMTCVRKDFDKNDVGTYAEDLPFNVIVKGETLSKTQPGDITFEISAEDATTKSDDTDGYSLTVTAAPRWNLQKSMYTTYTGYEYNGVKGWLMDYKFYIEVDEVDGEIDNASALVGNESMGKDATFTFKDDLSSVSPNATLVGCSFKGRFNQQDGYVGSADPLTYSGAGSIWGDDYPERKIPQTADEREITCTQTGSIIDITAKHIDATLTNYPKLDYRGYKLPVNRGIAAIGSIYVFVPLDDVKPQSQGGNNPEEEGWLRTTNTLTNFDPVTPTGNANFGGERESELDNSYSYTLYYSRGSFNKYYRGDSSSVWSYPGGAITYRSGDGMATQGYEFSTILHTNNTGGTPFTQEKMCDVVDAYRLEIQDIEDNQYYNIIKTYYSDAYHVNSRPIMYRIWNGDGNYTNGLTEEPYVFEYASTYEDDSWLPSRGGDKSVTHTAEVVAECNAPDSKWFATADEARNDPNGIGAVTKVRIRLRDGVEHIPGAYVYMWLNHKVRATDLKTGLPLENGDEIANFAANSFNGAEWTGPSYRTQNFPEPHDGTRGDRIIFTGPKVRIIKDVDKVALTAGDTATFNLKISFTNDTGIEEYGNVRVTDLLPKGLKYIAKSVTAPYSEPVIGSCADVLDINSTDTPCDDAENQVLIWDLGNRRAGEVFPDINYSVVVGVEVNSGTIRNVAKIESPTDASQISQRKSDVGMSITIPASINIVKSTEENPNYPSLRERTTTPQTIDFVMDMRNGKAGDITDLDVIDILPFKGDGNDGAIKFNTLELKRKVDTSYHGTSIFSSVELLEHPLSSSLCDLSANGGVKYYYTNADPTTINIAPTVGDANVIDGADTIWCEGDENGPNGCNGLSNSDVTAVRARGPRMEADAICQLKVALAVKDNLAGDNYSNSAGASATGITLPVLSNSLAVPIVGSSLGDRVWYDRDANGIQDENENGIAGVTVKLLDGSGTPVKNPQSPTDDYVVKTDSNGNYIFTHLNSGDYIVEFVTPKGFLLSPKGASGNSSTDSDVNSATSQTDVISLSKDSKDLTIDAGYSTPILSGFIFDDGNNDGTVNGVKFNDPSNTPLFVTLLDANGTQLSSKVVLSDGSYFFDGEDGVISDSNYTIVLSTAVDSIVADLPVNWNNADGEHIGTGAGLDGAADGKIEVVVAQSNVENINFGINEEPVANDVTQEVQFNPAGTNEVNVPDLNVTDREDGIPEIITITTLPSNATLYYKGSPVTVDQNISNLSSGELTIDPDSGEQTVEFSYTTTDKSGIVSEPATVTMPFKDLKISGNLFIDGNGDENVNGTLTSSADGVQLYVSLLNGGSVVSSKALSGGSYEFDIEDGVRANTNYTVVLSDSNGTTTANLPTDWDNNDGENINSMSATGNDGAKDGVLAVNVVTSDVTKADFGINKKPVASDVREEEQINPGASSRVDVPDLNISDNESSNLSVTIITVPDNATLYYNGAIVEANTTIDNFNNALLTIDPDAGSQSVTFNYSVTDAAGTTSNSAKVEMSFANITISGRVFNDGNGNGNVDGEAINSADGVQLYVTLVDAAKTPIASKPLDINGTYYFDSVDNLSPDSNYTVVLTNTQTSTVATLPENWNNADGENIGLVGLDGHADGEVAVEVKRVDITEINFGINKQPVAQDRVETLQYNPGRATQVVVPDLNVTDKEDGVPTVVTITALPTNGTLYYEGNPVEVNAPISDVNLSGFTFDPNDGDLTATFKYTTTDRVGVSSKEATVTMPFRALKISGHIFNDGDNDGVVNGVGISAPSGTQLYVALLDENGTLLASKEVNSDGTYSFGDKDGIVEYSSYEVILSTSLDETNASLPESWSNLDGEHIGTDAGTDGSSDGRISVDVENTDVVEVNFGINKKPVAGDYTAPLQLNPGGDVQVNVPDLNITDNEDGTLSTVTIQTLPTHGTLYYNGVEVVAGQVINDLNNSLLTLDPDNGDQTVSFTYSTIDAAGVESDIATVSMLFKGLKISGNIFNDGNNDNSVNGVKISEINATQLYATLLDSRGVVLSTVAIDSNSGSYQFDGVDGIVPNSSYSVVLSIEANATNSTLLADWNHADGEEIAIRGGVGLDGTADGLIAVDVVESDVIEVNFGVNERPKAKDKYDNLRINPGADNQVAVPNLEISDREDGVPNRVVVTALPTNGVLYYNGTPVVEGREISSVDVSKFTIDPDHGDVNVTFNYVSVDATGWYSKEAKVVMPFYGLKISGQIFLDVTDNHQVDGVPFTPDYGLDVYATLLDDSGVIIATVPTDDNGNYIFDETIGVAPNSNYKVVLSSEANNTTATLPSNWEHADSNNNGIIDVSVALSDVTDVDFGLNQQPVVTNVVGATLVNPDGNRTVAVPTLDIGFNEDGTTRPTTVTLSNLPTNGRLYYNGVVVTEGQTFTDFNNSLLRVDPDDYNLTVEFTYTVTDSAGFESEPATVKMPFDDSDTDGDGIKNHQDIDDDNDGILDRVEEATASNGGDSDGDGTPDRLDLDSDGDGILDLEESDNNSTAVAKIDSNGDGVLDSRVDQDGDGLMDTADADDNSSLSGAIVTPVDTDGDGKPDFQDVDSDNDGLSDLVEGSFHSVEEGNTTVTQSNANLDSNNDGVIDDLTDSDLDGIADVVDADSNGTVATTPDTDGDGKDNYRDLDSDGDTLLDVDEINATDANHDGLVDINGTLVDGTTLPDENNNGIPDILEIKLKDDVKSAPAGSVVRIKLLENDTGDVDPSSITFVIPDDFDATARLSIDQKVMVVDGEGEWRVDENGTVTFTPEAGFEGNPTPILYKASNRDGSKTAVAKITIYVTALAGVSADEACPDYTSSSSVPSFNLYGLILMVILGTLFGAKLIRKES